MRDALKPSLHYVEEPYNFSILRKPGSTACCDVGTFLMHAECKDAKPREFDKTANQVCLQTLICLPHQNVWVNVTS